MKTYEQDRVAWSEEQGRVLRQQTLARVDRKNVAAEIERLGSGDGDEVRERLRILLTALLRWAYQVDLRSVALSSTIFAQRHALESILQDSAALSQQAAEIVVDVYPEAKRAAVIESGLFDESFPEGLPFLPEEVRDYNFLPDPFGDDAIRGEGWWRRRG